MASAPAAKRRAEARRTWAQCSGGGASAAAAGERRPCAASTRGADWLTGTTARVVLGCKPARSPSAPPRASTLRGDVLLSGAFLKLEDLLGRRARYQGEGGRVIGGDLSTQGQAVLIVRISRSQDAPRRELRLPEPEWEQLELLD